MLSRGHRPLLNELVYFLFTQASNSVIKVLARRKGRFDVISICSNLPDFTDFSLFLYRIASA
jgi:hypothetical protein